MSMEPSETTEENSEGSRAAEASQTFVEILKEGKRYYLTALLIFALAVMGLVFYLVKYRPMEFFYVLF